MFRLGLLFHKPLSPKHRSTFSSPQRTATLIFSVDWGLGGLGIEGKSAWARGYQTPHFCKHMCMSVNPRGRGFTQGSPPYMWRHLLQSLGVPRFPSAGRCTHIGIADHPPRLQTPAAQLTSVAGIRGNAFSPRFGRLDDPKTPEIAQTAMRACIRRVYGDSVGRSDRRFCNLRLAYRGQRDPPSPNTSRRFGATTPGTALQS